MPAAGHRRDAVAEQLPARDEDARRPGPADELVGRDEDRVLVGERIGLAPVRPSRRTGPSRSTTYGAAAAKSQNDSAPCRWSRIEIARTSLMTPVTFEAAENEPIFSGRSAWATSSASRRARSIRPSWSSGMTTTSASDSRQGSSLLWCSYGPMKTTGRSRGGDRRRAGRSDRRGRPGAGSRGSR